MRSAPWRAERHRCYNVLVLANVAKWSGLRARVACCLRSAPPSSSTGLLVQANGLGSGRLLPSAVGSGSSSSEQDRPDAAVRRTARGAAAPWTPTMSDPPHVSWSAVCLHILGLKPKERRRSAHATPIKPKRPPGLSPTESMYSILYIQGRPAVMVL